MRKAFGYIVVGKWGVVGLTPYPGAPSNVLWCNHLTLFHTRRKAQSAIEATKKYSAAQGYSWPVETFIVRMVDFATHA